MDDFNPNDYLAALREQLNNPESELTVAGGRPKTGTKLHQLNVIRVEAAALAYRHGFRSELEAAGDTKTAVAFVKNFARCAVGLTLISDRAVDQGLAHDSVLTLTDDDRQALFATLLDDFVGLHQPERLGLSAVALQRSTVLTMTGRDFDRLADRHPDVAPGTIRHFVLKNPKDPASALKRFETTVAYFSQQYPDIEPWTIRYFAINNRTDPKTAVERLERTITELADQNPDLGRNIIRHFALHNPKDPQKAIAKFEATVARLLQEHSDIDPGVIRLIAVNNRKKPAAAIRRYRANVERLTELYPDAKASVISRAASSYPTNPEAGMDALLAEHVAKDGPGSTKGVGPDLPDATITLAGDDQAARLLARMTRAALSDVREIAELAPRAIA